MLASQLQIVSAVRELNLSTGRRSLWPHLQQTWRARRLTRVCLPELRRRSSTKLRTPPPTYMSGSNVITPIHAIAVHYGKRRQEPTVTHVGDCGPSDQTVTMGASSATQSLEETVVVTSSSGVSLHSTSPPPVPASGGADWLYLVGKDERQISTVSRLRDEGALKLPDGLKLCSGRACLSGSYAGAVMTTEAAASRDQNVSHVVLANHHRKKCDEGFKNLQAIAETTATGHQHRKEQNFAETAWKRVIARDSPTSMPSTCCDISVVADDGPCGGVSSEKTRVADVAAVPLPKGLGAVSILSISRRTPCRSTESFSANGGVVVRSATAAEGISGCLLQERQKQQNTSTDRSSAGLCNEGQGVFQGQAPGVVGVGGERIVDEQCDSRVAGTSRNDRYSERHFDVPRFFSLLSTSQLGKLVVYAHRMPSTQTFLLQNSHCLSEGTVCVADLQMVGKGRGGNVWESPEGCLMFSFTQTATNGRTLPFLQYVVTLAVVQGIESLVERLCGSTCPIDIKIKWPNDIYASGMKIGGVLCNSTYRDRRFNLVIGVGLNVSNGSPTICLNELLNSANHPAAAAAAPKIVIGKEHLLASILAKFEEVYSCFKVHGFSPLKEEYHSRWMHSGQRLILLEQDPNGGDHNNGSLPGRGIKEVPVVVEGLSENGFLLAVDESGEQVELHPDVNSLDLFKGLVRRKVSV